MAMALPDGGVTPRSGRTLADDIIALVTAELEGWRPALDSHPDFAGLIVAVKFRRGALRVTVAPQSLRQVHLATPPREISRHKPT
jgi:hypothetical protein